MFDINSKVVCTDDRFPNAAKRHLKYFPTKGKIYTVRDIIPAQGYKGDHNVAVLLNEIVNPPSPFRPDWGECGFDPRRFREVDETTEVKEEKTFATFTS
jgi:hypothetical protein